MKGRGDDSRGLVRRFGCLKADTLSFMALQLPVRTRMADVPPGLPTWH